MTIDDKIEDERPQYDINRKAAKMSALSSGKIDNYEYLTGKEILSSDQRRIIEQAKFTYSPLSKAFGEQIKTIEDQGIKQDEAFKAWKQEENQELESIEGNFPKKMRSIEIKNEIDKIKKWEEKIKRKDFIYRANKCKHNFQQYWTIKSFDESIYIGKINIDEAEIDQSNLLENMVEFNKKSRPRKKEDKEKNTFESVNALYEGQELTLNALNS